eukprot:623787-Rhodomonas_salina.1
MRGGEVTRAHAQTQTPTQTQTHIRDSDRDGKCTRGRRTHARDRETGEIADAFERRWAGRDARDQHSTARTQHAQTGRTALPTQHSKSAHHATNTRSAQHADSTSRTHTPHAQPHTQTHTHKPHNPHAKPHSRNSTDPELSSGVGTLCVAPCPAAARSGRRQRPNAPLHAQGWRRLRPGSDNLLGDKGLSQGTVIGSCLGRGGTCCLGRGGIGEGPKGRALNTGRLGTSDPRREVPQPPQRPCSTTYPSASLVLGPSGVPHYVFLGLPRSSWVFLGPLST